MESEAPTTSPSTDGNDVSLEKEYLTSLFHFSSLVHECASGRRLAYTNCLQNLVLLDSFPNFRPWWFDKQWNIIHPTSTSSPVARILNKPLKRLNLSFEFLGQNCSKIASFIMSMFQRQLVIVLRRLFQSSLLVFLVAGSLDHSLTIEQFSNDCRK